MKINRPLLIALLLLSIVIYVSCRKMDRLVNGPTTQEIESRFFTEHAPANPLVQAVRQFVKGENEKYHFVDRLKKQIGYPQWDKAIIASGSSVKGGRGASDSSNTVFIPFVLDSQHAVNASLVVNTTPSDTTFRFICDWQYKDRINGSPSLDTSAENLSLLFMILDNNVFGHKRFTLTDSSLFGNMPVPQGLSGREIVIDHSANISGISNVTEIETILVCFYGYVCGTPTWCTNHGGCDYLNCPTQVCYATSTCFEFEVEEETGGGTGGGTGGTGGTGGSGGSGGGGGWTPPNNPCGPPSPSRNNIQTPCGPGWVPLPLPDPGSASYNLYQYDTIGIKNSIRDSFPCLYSFIHDSLPNANFLAQIAGAMVFKDSAYMHLTFDTSTTLIGPGHAAAETITGAVTVGSDGITQYHAEIYFNGWNLRNSTKEYMISTIVHEVMHAIIRLRWGQYIKWLQFGPPNDIDSNFMKAHYPIYFYAFTNQPVPPQRINDHLIMATDYFNLQKSIVGQFWNPAAPAALKDSVLKALCYGGIQETTAWKLLGSQGIDTCRYKAIDVSAGASKTTPYIPDGCGTYNLHFSDSLKLRQGCN